MKNYLLIILWSVMLWSAACGSSLNYQAREYQALVVTDITPPNGAILDDVPLVSVTLNQAIDPDSVTKETFFVVKLPATSIRASNAYTGKIMMSEDARTIFWQPEKQLDAAQEYQVVLTSGIQTNDHYPLTTSDETEHHWSSRFLYRGLVLTDEQSPNTDVNLQPRPDFLMISELYYDPPETETDGFCFIELYGTPKSSLDGYEIWFVNGADGKVIAKVVLPKNKIIPSNGYFVIADQSNNQTGISNVNGAQLIANFDPQNGPDSVWLIDADGNRVDTLGYGEGLMPLNNGEIMFESTPALDAPQGQSLERSNLVDTDDNQNDFVVSQVPSPGTGHPIDVNLTDYSSQAVKVAIIAVVTDPQRDWNDSSGGNGIPFDAIVGNGTVGSTDEWVVLRNQSDENLSLKGWKLEMIDGSDATEIFDTPSGEYRFSNSGTVENFQVGELLLIGNPEDDMKNSLTLRLLDQANELVDEIILDDSNANSTADEVSKISDDKIISRGENDFFF